MTQLIDMPDAVASTQQRNRLHALGVITVVAGILGAAPSFIPRVLDAAAEELS